MRNNLFIGYLIFLHLFLLLILWKTDFIPRVGYRFGFIKQIDPEITQHYEETAAFLERIDNNIPDETVIFIGDSGIQGLCVSAVVCPSVNFGIGTDTTIGVLKRLPRYQSLQRARACVLSIGGNDLRRRANEEILENYNKILQTIPQSLPLVIIAILPVDERVRDDLAGRNRRTGELNDSLKILCEAQGPRCAFVDPGPILADASGNLKKQYHVGDGVHLNGGGNSILIQKLKESVPRVKHQ